MSDKIDYLGEERVNISTPAEKKENTNQQEIKGGYVEKISLGFQEIIENLSIFQISTAPTFIGFRAGISDRFIDEAILPSIRNLLNDKPVIFPIMRFIWGGNLKPFVAQTKSMENLQSPSLFEELAIEAFKELINSVDPKVKRYLKTSNPFIRDRHLPFSQKNADCLIKKQYLKELPSEVMEQLVDDINKIATNLDPICYRNGITVFGARNQHEALTMLNKILEQSQKGCFAYGNNDGVIVLLELFEPINSDLCDVIRKLLREWIDGRIILWIHAAVQYMPLELLDQFQNYIIIQPSPIEIDKLQNIQKIDIGGLGLKGSKAIVKGPGVLSRKDWGVISISDIDCLESTEKISKKFVNQSVLREIINQIFSDDQIFIFCQDNFLPVFNEFTGRMLRSQKISMLLEYCDKNNEFEKLIELLQKRAPSIFTKFEKNLYV